MSQPSQVVDDLFDALRLRRALSVSVTPVGELESERSGELTRYIEVMTSHGHDRPDEVELVEASPSTGVLPSIVVTYGSPSDLWRAVRRNIRKDGIFIHTGHFPPIDTQVLLTVSLLEPRVSFQTEAKVIWVNPHARSGRPMGLGLKFQWATGNQRQLFERFMLGDEAPQNLANLV